MQTDRQLIYSLLSWRLYDSMHCATHFSAPSQHVTSLIITSFCIRQKNYMDGNHWKSFSHWQISVSLCVYVHVQMSYYIYRLCKWVCVYISVFSVLFNLLLHRSWIILMLKDKFYRCDPGAQPDTRIYIFLKCCLVWTAKRLRKNCGLGWIWANLTRPHVLSHLFSVPSWQWFSP